MEQSASTMSLDVETVDLDFDALNNVEESAYKDGYDQGFDHGALHGKFEGRELGREKGFELWEEVGFYDGSARVWRMLLMQAEQAGQTSRKQTKQLQHLAGLQRLISFFPMVNDSSDPSSDLTAAAPAADTSSNIEEEAEEEGEPELDSNDEELAKLDMLALLEKIRAKYRLTCSVLGVAPRQAPPSPADPNGESIDTSGNAQTSTKPDRTVMVAGKLVDPTQLGY